MLKDELVKVKLSNKNISYYKKVMNNYNLSVNDVIGISSNLISNGSSIKVTAICDVCGKEKKLSKKNYNIQSDFGKGIITCSKGCSLIKTQKTNLEKWGHKNVFQSKLIKEKIKETNKDKYGVENPQQFLPIKFKTKNTNLKRWGYNTPSKSELVKDKVKKTNNIKFGFDYPSKNSYIIDKMKMTTLEKYGVDNFSKTKEFKEVISKKSFNRMLNKLKSHGELINSENSEYEINCKKCNNSYKILHSLMYNRITNGDIICTFCNPKNQNIQENELYDFIRENYNGEIIRNSRSIISNELDIYLPDLYLAFEFNGLYWHSELYKEKNYHLNKTKECEEKGIQLIHVWEDDWNYKKDIVKSIIINKINKSKRIFARKTEIKELYDNKLVREFLVKNHIQGFVGSSLKFGLFYNGELVSLMTFGKLRVSLGQKSTDGCYELLRFCNKRGFSVTGGASKLFKYFIRKYKPIKVLSYSDNSISKGDMYEKIGFKFLSNTVPNYYWVIDGIRNYRFNYRKDRLVKQGFDKEKSESQIMSDRGYYKCFNSGSKKWLYQC